MSVETLAVVLHHSRATGTAKVVMIGIANHDGDGGSWPSVGTLARYANVDPRTIKRTITALEKAGELRRHIQAGGTRDTADHERPNRYDVLVGCPEGCDRSTAHRPMRGFKRLPDGSFVPVDNGVTPVSPGDASVTPPSDTDVTQTVPSTGRDNRPSASVTGGAYPAGLCAVCGNGFLRCQVAQAAWPVEDRHEFTAPTDLAPRRPAADRDRARDQRTDDKGSNAPEADPGRGE